MARQRQAEKFEVADAKERDAQIALVIGLMGPPGGGKTYSALLLAKGMKKVRGGDIIMIDTDNDRSLQYRDDFDFKHMRIRPPFRPLRFRDALVQADKLKPAAIILDTISDEHEGQGGVLDYKEDELDRFLGDDKDNWSKRDAQGQRAWINPKAERGAWINAMMQLENKTPVILCFRSREKTKPMQKSGSNRTEIVKLGWQPIAPAEVLNNCTLVCLLRPRADGVPTWKSGINEEDFVLKLPKFARPIFAKEGPLTEEHGEALATWLKGGHKSSRKESSTPERGARSAGDAGASTGSKEPPADQPDDSFPADRKVKFLVVDLKGNEKAAPNGDAWADLLVKWIEKRDDKGAAESWRNNKKHVEAAEKQGGDAALAAQRVWVAAQKRGLEQ